jgi:hypothetical protein
MKSMESDEVLICGLCDEHLENEDEVIKHFLKKHKFEMECEGIDVEKAIKFFEV